MPFLLCPLAVFCDWMEVRGTGRGCGERGLPLESPESGSKFESLTFFFATPALVQKGRSETEKANH